MLLGLAPIPCAMNYPVHCSADILAIGVSKCTLDLLLNDLLKPHLKSDCHQTDLHFNPDPWSQFTKAWMAVGNYCFKRASVLQLVIQKKIKNSMWDARLGF